MSHYHIKHCNDGSRKLIPFQNHDRHPYLALTMALTGELWGVCCENFWENWPCFNGNALCFCIVWKNATLSITHRKAFKGTNYHNEYGYDEDIPPIFSYNHETAVWNAKTVACSHKPHVNFRIFSNKSHMRNDIFTCMAISFRFLFYFLKFLVGKFHLNRKHGSLLQANYNWLVFSIIFWFGVYEHQYINEWICMRNPFRHFTTKASGYAPSTGDAPSTSEWSTI